jgi:hypothetical protein
VVSAEDGAYVGTAGDRAVFLETGDFLVGIDRGVTTYDRGGRQWAQSQLSGINECGGCQVQWAYVSNDKRYVIAAARDMTNPSAIPGPGIAFYERVAGTFLSAESDPTTGPSSFELLPAYPNPFNPSTSIPFQLGRGAHIRLEAFDLLGRRVAVVANAWHDAGRHFVSFDASGLASGLYMIRLTAVAGRNVHTRHSQVTLVR